MSLKIGSTLAAGLVVASLAGSLETVGAAAAAHNKSVAMAAHRLYRAAGVSHRHYVLRRSFEPAYAYARPAPYAASHYYAAPRRVDGYIYLPGRGILGEACNLPTSACSNLYRDTR